MSDIVTRADAWVNFMTGAGTSRDKSQATMFLPDGPIPFRVLWALFHEDPIAKKIVRLPVQEAFRNGFCLEVEGDPSAAKKLETAAESISLVKAFKQCATWERVTGGAAIVLYTPDLAGLGGNLRLPMPAKSRGLLGVEAFHAERFGVLDRYTVHNAPSVGLIGKPMLWAGSTIDGRYLVAHASRVIVFEGEECSDDLRMSMRGFGLSALQAPYDTLQKFHTGHSGMLTLLSDASQAVYKIKDLWKQIGGTQKSNLQERMGLVDRMRSSLRAVILDTEESFERVPTPFAGIPESMGALRLLLASACDIPMTRLFGTSPAGMSATGESDEKNWNKQIASIQEQSFSPPLLKLYQQLSTGLNIDAERVSIDWKPLDEPSEKEKADTAKVQADTDVAYFDMGALTPQEIRVARFTGRAFDAILDAENEAALLTQDPLDVAPSVTPQAKAETPRATFALAPTDIATVTTVNEARANLGLPPWPDQEQGKLTMAAFKALSETSGEVIGEAVGANEAQNTPTA
jgi:phage-related protein (TIGR01555 family)